MQLLAEEHKQLKSLRSDHLVGVSDLAQAFFQEVLQSVYMFLVGKVSEKLVGERKKEWELNCVVLCESMNEEIFMWNTGFYWDSETQAKWANCYLLLLQFRFGLWLGLHESFRVSWPPATPCVFRLARVLIRVAAYWNTPHIALFHFHS